MLLSKIMPILFAFLDNNIEAFQFPFSVKIFNFIPKTFPLKIAFSGFIQLLPSEFISIRASLSSDR